jgi:hypothetical protein
LWNEAPVAGPRQRRDAAPEGNVPPLARRTEFADGGRHSALSVPDERREPVAHPIELATRLDSQPRAFAPVTHANEPAHLAAHSERADASARLAREEPRESVQIHIGRLEVVAIAEPAQRKPPKSDAPKYMSLNAHLARRSGRAG